MEKAYKDETRWLARMLAIIFFLLAFRGVIVQCQRIYVDQNWISFFFLGISFLLFWFGYQLWICSSLWNVFLWFSETSTVVLYMQSQYYRINKHVRSGLVGGMILLLFIVPLPSMFSYYEGVWFCEFIKHILYTILWPLKQLFEILNVFQSHPEYNRSMIIFGYMYLFAIGFVAGALISFITGRIIHTCDKQSPKDLNNGSPGFSAAEPGE
ncbi:MAG: hypothetical protein ACYS8O_04315 [Planctomycetota bacterium]|jgi:hypothetical protein